LVLRYKSCAVIAANDNSVMMMIEFSDLCFARTGDALCWVGGDSDRCLVGLWRAAALKVDLKERDVSHEALVRNLKQVGAWT
jgi:hypothetical protein